MPSLAGHDLGEELTTVGSELAAGVILEREAGTSGARLADSMLS